MAFKPLSLISLFSCWNVNKLKLEFTNSFIDGTEVKLRARILAVEDTIVVLPIGESCPTLSVSSAKLAVLIDLLLKRLCKLLSLSFILEKKVASDSTSNSGVPKTIVVGLFLSALANPRLAKLTNVTTATTAAAMLPIGGVMKIPSIKPAPIAVIAAKNIYLPQSNEN